jgi:hypothetical protein
LTEAAAVRVRAVDETVAVIVEAISAILDARGTPTVRGTGALAFPCIAVSVSTDRRVTAVEGAAE